MKIRVALAAISLLFSGVGFAAEVNTTSGTYPDEDSFASGVVSGDVLRIVAQPDNSAEAKNLWRSIVTIMESSYGLPRKMQRVDATGNLGVDNDYFNRVESCLGYIRSQAFKMMNDAATISVNGPSKFGPKSIPDKLQYVNGGCVSDSPVVPAFNQFYADYRKQLQSYVAAHATAKSTASVLAAQPVQPNAVAQSADSNSQVSPVQSTDDSGQQAPVEASDVGAASGLSNARTETAKAEFMAKVSSGQIPQELAKAAGKNAFEKIPVWTTIVSALQSSYGLTEDIGPSKYLDNSNQLQTCMTFSRPSAIDALIKISPPQNDPITVFKGEQCPTQSPFLVAFNQFMIDYKAALAPYAAAKKAEADEAAKANEIAQAQHDHDEAMANAGWITFLVLLLAVVGLGIRGIILGINNKVIFYGSNGDVLKTCLLVVAAIALVLIPTALGKDHATLSGILVFAMMPVGLYIVVAHSKSVDREMNTFDAISVAIGKIILLVFAFAQLTRGNNPKNSELQNYSEKVSGAIILIGIGYLVSRLINRNKYFAVKLAERFGIRTSKSYLADIERWLDEDLDGEVNHGNFEEIYALFSSELSSTVGQMEAPA